VFATGVDVFPIYEALWAWVKSEGVIIRYGNCTNGEGGYFIANDPEQPIAMSEENAWRPNRPWLVIDRPWPKTPTSQPSRENNAPVGKPQPDLRSELLTLAHECGHMCSWKGRTPRDQWLIYAGVEMHRYEVKTEIDAELAGVKPSITDLVERARWLSARMFERLTDDQRARIVHEETLAWQIGRELLARFGLTDFDGYEQHAELHVHNHRAQLGMEEMTNEDIRIGRARLADRIGSDAAKSD